MTADYPSPAWLQAFGSIAFAAGGLEGEIAKLCRSLSRHGEPIIVEVMLPESVSALLTVCRDLVNLTVEEGSGRQSLLDWLSTAERLVAERNKRLHSQYALAFPPDGDVLMVIDRLRKPRNLSWQENLGERVSVDDLIDLEQRIIDQLVLLPSIIEPFDLPGTIDGQFTGSKYGFKGKLITIEEFNLRFPRE